MVPHRLEKLEPATETSPRPGQRMLYFPPRFPRGNGETQGYECRVVRCLPPRWLPAPSLVVIYVEYLQRTVIANVDDLLPFNNADSHADRAPASLTEPLLGEVVFCGAAFASDPAGEPAEILGTYRAAPSLPRSGFLFRNVPTPVPRYRLRMPGRVESSRRRILVYEAPRNVRLDQEYVLEGLRIATGQTQWRILPQPRTATT